MHYIKHFLHSFHPDLIIALFSSIECNTDYGKGTTVLQEERGKIYGAAYEVLIIAFF